MECVFWYNLPANGAFLISVFLLFSWSPVWSKPRPSHGRISSVGTPVERLTAGAEGRRLDSWGRTITQGLEITGNEGTPFTLQAARPWSGSDDHAKWPSRLQ